VPADLLSRPKAELHCHSDGLLDPAMARALDPTDQGASLADELARCYPIRSMEEWEGYVRILDRFLGAAPKRLLGTILSQVERWRSQHVLYAELFVNRVTLGIQDEGVLVEWFRTLRSLLDAGGVAPRVNLVACIGRGPSDRLARQSTRIGRLARLGLITGVAYAGNELACSIKENGRYFDQFHEWELGIEIHAGEDGGPESVRDALDFGHPGRLGHGVRAFEDEALVDRLREENVHLEFCPTSNLRLGVVSSVADLPIRRALDAGVPFSINTDDPGVFGCSLTSEIQLVRDQFELTDLDLDRVHRATMAAAFGPVAVTGAAS
jgi:adenosine deaminase